mmetsp:Transcript_33190/g.38266  ORF Transcript_33190/g.38266 Transcript_33190/m.38266 type:complete len:184 (-) Transcript_33190:2604-3155(-)
MTNTKSGITESDCHKYDSISNEEEAGKVYNTNFKESDLYYYKEDERTKREKIIRIMNSTFPILIFILLIGGITWGLIQNFGKLYLSPSGHRASNNIKNSSSHQASSYTTDDGTDDDIHDTIQTHKISTDTTKKYLASSSCLAYPKCMSLELTGECCPTLAGDKLDCCNQFTEEKGYVRSTNIK